MSVSSSGVLSKSLDLIKSFRTELLLSLILFIGLSLRIYHLGSESIWLDEAFSIKLSKYDLIGIIKGSASDTHPPLYHFLLHFWINLFGSSEFSTRFLSVIFGTFTIYATYRLGSLIFNKEAGLLSSLILALSEFHIHYSQEARMYSLLALMSLLSMFFFVKFIKEKKLRDSIGYIICSILLLYTHVYGLFIIAAQNIFIVCLFFFANKEFKINFKRWFFLQATLFIIFLPWLIVIVIQMMHIKKYFWIPVPSLKTPINYLKIYSGSNQFYLFIVLSVSSCISFKKLNTKIDWKNLFVTLGNNRFNISLSFIAINFFLILWLLIPNILPFIISRISTPIYWDRYTIGASIALYFLAANGLTKINSKSIKFFLIFLIMIFSLTNLHTYFSAVHKEQWRDVANYIDSNAEKSDLILFNAGFNRMPFNYYSKRKDLIKKPFPEKTRDVNNENIKRLKPIVNGSDRVWVILSKSHDFNNMIKKTLGESYNLSYNKEYFIQSYTSNSKQVAIEVDLFEKNKDYSDKNSQN